MEPYLHLKMYFSGSYTLHTFFYFVNLYGEYIYLIAIQIQIIVLNVLFIDEHVKVSSVW